MSTDGRALSSKLVTHLCFNFRQAAGHGVVREDSTLEAWAALICRWSCGRAHAAKTLKALCTRRVPHAKRHQAAAADLHLHRAHPPLVSCVQKKHFLVKIWLQLLEHSVVTMSQSLQSRNTFFAANAAPMVFFCVASKTLLIYRSTKQDLPAAGSLL